MKYKYSPETKDTFPCIEPAIETGADDAIVLDGATDDQGVIFAEALNSYEETSLTPSQLAEQRAELLGALKDSLVIHAGLSADKSEDLALIRQIITKCEATPGPF